MLPSGFAPQLTGVATIEITDAPARVEYVIWAEANPTPAATAFLAPSASSLSLGHSSLSRRPMWTRLRP